MYAWAIGEGLCETNPVDGTNKADEGKPRDRVLSDKELAAVWNAAPEGDYGSIVKLLMLTAQRRDEIGSLRWSEIDTEAKTITLPASRTKNGREHVIPLSAQALAIIKATPQRANRDLVFGSGDGGYSGWSKAKAAMDEKLGKGVAGWTLHDLRRTGATRMADSGVQPHIIEAVLNHVSGHKEGVAGIYNRAAYEPEKRAALDTLGSYIKTAMAKADGSERDASSGRPMPVTAASQKATAYADERAVAARKGRQGDELSGARGKGVPPSSKWLSVARLYELMDEKVRLLSVSPETKQQQQTLGRSEG